MSSDYDFEPREAPSAFLKLKEKGDRVLIRIASPPYREPKVWKADVKAPLGADETLALSEAQWYAIMRNPDFNVTETFSWKVLDRETGLAKIFSATPGVYKSIKEFAVMPEWGDPKNYDIIVERTEQPGRGYYKVTAMPNKSDITEAEMKLVDALSIGEKLPVARRLNEVQVDHIPEMDEQPAAPGAPQDADVPPANPDIVIEDIGDEPINLNDIPF